MTAKRKTKESRCKGEGVQRQDRHLGEKNEMGELKEGNGKRKVKVGMQEDCILLRLLCVLSPVPYLMDLV